jgi:hypothetical protein
MSESNAMSAEGEPHPMSREASRQLADRLYLSKSPTAIRSEKELHLIIAALRYYGNAPWGDIVKS